MILDSEKQRKLIMTLVNASTFTGDSVEEICDFKNAVKNATLMEDSIDPTRENDKAE